jgi:hypothetical protein
MARAELRRGNRGEVARPQIARVRDPPAETLLEMVRQGDEVIAGLAVGSRNRLGIAEPVGAIGMAVQIAPPEAPFAASQQISSHAR